MQVSDLGWVDLVLRVPLAAGPPPLATYCPSRMREHAKSESAQPRSETYGHPVLIESCEYQLASLVVCADEIRS